MATTSSSSTPACPLSIREVLEVLLLCFEAAADGLPPCPFAYAKSIPAAATPTGISSFVIWMIDHLKQDPPSATELSLLTFPPESLPTALARFNMCDFFAILLVHEAKKRMQEYFGARVEWTLVAPVPAVGLFPWNEQNFVPCTHSVLVITEANGAVMVMDETSEQFHWSRSTWLLSQAEFAARMTGWQIAHVTRVRPVELAMEQRDNGYWAVVQERMEALFGGLDWSVLFTLPTEDRVALVTAKAEATFAGGWSEACQRAGVQEGLE
jgi:hypothetical protein